MEQLSQNSFMTFYMINGPLLLLGSYMLFSIYILFPINFYVLQYYFHTHFN